MHYTDAIRAIHGLDRKAAVGLCCHAISFITLAAAYFVSIGPPSKTLTYLCLFAFAVNLVFASLAAILLRSILICLLIASFFLMFASFVPIEKRGAVVLLSIGAINLIALYPKQVSILGLLMATSIAGVAISFKSIMLLSLLTTAFLTIRSLRLPQS